MAITPKKRFEIFKRDGFTCKYCGKTPPEVTLEADHIIPVVEGGTDDMNNLITACFACNRGKSKISLQVLPTTITENIAVIKEQQKQTKQYYKYLAQIETEKEGVLQEIGTHFFNTVATKDDEKDKYVFAGSYKTSIKIFLKTFNKYQIIEAIDIAAQRLGRRHSHIGESELFRYMCGILHNWRREKNGVD